MREEGWYLDPFGHHDARSISDGAPTALVRDGDVESHDPPPEGPFSGTLQPVPEEPRAGGGDLRRADEAESSTSESTVRAVLDVFDQTGWPLTD